MGDGGHRAEVAARRLLAEHHGVLARDEALAAGFSRRQIDVRLQRGEWIRVHPATYRHATFPFTWHQQLAAAVAWAGHAAGASHRSAVAVIGLRGFRPEIIEISRPRGRRHSPAGVVVHESADLDGTAIELRDGVRVTTPARTLADVGAAVPEWLVARCLEEWLADRVVTISQLRAAVDATARRGRPGPRVLRHLLDTRILGDAVADSAAEAALARLLVAHGLPRPEHHHLAAADTGRVIAELDYAYPAHRVALELDGYGVHLRSRAAFEGDRVRQNELEIAGWRVLRFAARQLWSAPELVVSQVRRVLAATRPLTRPRTAFPRA